MNPFDFVKAINGNKEDLMSGTDNDVLAEKSYDPFVTNRSLSYFQDTVGIANEMNISHFLDKKLQFHFLLNIVRPRKRFSKWFKKQNDEDVSLIKTYYGYNEANAIQALSILTSDDIANIKSKMDKGGRK